MKDLCQVWQFKTKEGSFENHSDVRCIIYNIYYEKFKKNPAISSFNISKVTVNFKEMQEFVENDKNDKKEIKLITSSVRTRKSSRP